MASLSRVKGMILIYKNTAVSSHIFKYSCRTNLHYKFYAFGDVACKRKFSQFSYQPSNSFILLNNNIRKCSTKTESHPIISTSEHQNNSDSLLTTDIKTNVQSDQQNIIPENYIPEPPQIPDLSATTNVLLEGEPSFASQGLGGWSPIGLVQNGLEFFHVSLNIPWWASIVLGVCIIRIMMLPIFIISQRNMVKMNNKMPQMQALQLKLSEARRTGNQLLAARYAHDLLMFMKQENISPLKNMIAPMSQAPVFISVFFGLREMANLPVHSFTDGGILWFTNLTLPDPYYILPLITSATVLLTIELGTEGVSTTQNVQLMRYFLRAIPVIIFPFTMNFPAAILCYWVTNNFISLVLVGLVRIPIVSKTLKIGKKIHHEPENLPLKPKGFVQGFNEAITNMKIVKSLEERMRIDEVRFRKSGLGAIQKTYPYDPTRQRPSIKTVSAKSRDEK